jgi:predicted RNase H-like HicB family nuclease
VRQSEGILVAGQELDPAEAGTHDLPGCIAIGQSREEVLRLIREAIEFHIEGLREAGKPVPVPSSVSEYVDVDAA